MPNNRKPEETRQDRSPGRALATVTSIAGRNSVVATKGAPKPGTGWLSGTRTQWIEFWESEVAGILTATHLPAVYRLFELRDAQARALRLYKREPMVQGSMKQPVVNPAMGTVQALEKDIRALEDRLGLTPKAQANLGIAIGEARMTAAQLNAMAREDDDDGNGGTEPGGSREPEPDDVLEAEWSESGWSEA